MPITDPTLGVAVVLDDAQFQQRMKFYLDGIDKMEKATDELANKSASADKKRADASEKAHDAMMKNIRSLRFEMVTLLYFLRLASQVWQAAWTQMGDSTEQAAKQMGIRALAKVMETDLGGVSAEIRDLAKNTLTAADSYNVVLQGMLIDQGQFSSEYARLWEAARVAAVTGMADSDEAFQAFIQDLVDGTGKATDAISPIYGVRNALKEYADETGRTVEQLSTLEAAQITLNQIYSTTSNLMAAGADDALDFTESWDAMQASIAEFKHILGLVVADSGVLKTVTDLFNTATQTAIMLAAAIDTVGSRMSALQKITQPGTLGLLAGLQIGQAGIGDPTEQFAENMRKYADALGYFRDETNKSLMDYEKLRAPDVKEEDYSSILDHIMKREQIMEDHRYRLSQIEARYNDRREKAELRYTQDVDKAHRDADRAREKAMRDFNRRKETLQRENNDRLAKLEEEYLLRLEQNRREYRMREMQSEAMYAYERSRLVAYGDVLGIEDLDARNELEKKARADNFDEQQRQERENYELRRKYVKDQMDDQLADLKRSLEDQLDEIRYREQERIAEADARRKEAIATALKDYNNQLAEEQRQHERSLDQWTQYWVKLAEKFKLGLAEIRTIIAQFFGSGGDMDSIMGNFTTKWTDYMSKLTMLEKLMANLKRTYTLPGIQSPTRKGGVWPFQYGGEGIFSSPTMLRVGENQPEMVSVRPLTSLGTLKLSWAGGPIPVQGSGLNGMDTTSLGDSIVQGLMMQMQRAIVNNGAFYG